MRFAAFVNRFLDRPHLNCIAIAILVVTIICLIISFLTPADRPTMLGTDLGYDYAVFYVAGQILHEGRSSQLYDLQLQYDLHHILRPYWPAERSYPFCYPPFAALLFQPLAALPYAYSYLVWLLISGGFFVSGLILLFKSIGPMPRPHLVTCALLAASFEPFVLESWLGGQMSSFGFFWMSLSFHLYQRRRCVGSGLALGMCLYKPTLLVVILPLLLIARKGRVLLGFTICGAALTAISIYGLGWHVCMEWVEFVWVRASGPSIPLTHKYIDAFAFCQLLLGELSQPMRVALVAVFGCWFVCFICLLKRFKANDYRSDALVAASIITWTAVINVYFPIYDATILILAVFLTVYALCGPLSSMAQRLRPALIVFLILIYAMPGISQGFAALAGFQPFTLVLICFGCYQLFMLREIAGSSEQPGQSCPAPQP